MQGRRCMLGSLGPRHASPPNQVKAASMSLLTALQDPARLHGLCLRKGSGMSGRVLCEPRLSVSAASCCSGGF
jgi:hypothetical protein